jgi:hypothetical protein
MGMYASVRGWIELDHKQRRQAEQIIEQAQDDPYSGGWGFPARPFNWTLYLFYGGDVREQALPQIRAQIERLAFLPPADEDGDRPRGLFVVTDERGNAERWEIQEGSVFTHAAPDFGWLAT